MKKTVGARELKTRLGSYIHQVRNGTTFVVTERGQPVAELRPLPLNGTNEEVRLSKLVATGKISRTSASSLQSFKPVWIKGKSLSETILEDRQDRL